MKWAGWDKHRLLLDDVMLVPANTLASSSIFRGLVKCTRLAVVGHAICKCGHVTYEKAGD